MAKQAKPVFIPGTNMQFPSASAAAKVLNINAGNIYSVLSGKRKTAGGYQFGYASNRTIYIPETGQAFPDIKSAARSVGVGAKKAIKGLEGRSGSAIGGYHFTYADASKISPPSSADTVSAGTKKQKKDWNANKQERIRKRKAERDARNLKIIGKRLEKEYKKAEKTVKNIEKEVAKYRRDRRKAVEQYKKAKARFEKFLTKVNGQLDVFYERHPNFIHYNPSTPEIFEYMNQIGNKDYTHFDTSLAAFNFDNKATPEDIKKLIRDMTELQTALELATKSHKKSFWDIKVAERERTELTAEFGLSNEGEMDKYADMIWEMIDIFIRAEGYDKLSSDRVYNAVKDAMQSSVDPKKISEFLDNLAAWMDSYPHGGDVGQQLFDELKGETEESQANADNNDFWDDDVWTI